jgi:imidazolonepropionase-like amidohydrolase
MNKPLTVLLLSCLAAPALPDTLAITGVRVHTVSAAGTLENATLLIEDGRIVAVGSKVELPAGAAIIDASGKVVTPGIFSPFGQLGLVEVDAVPGTQDAVQRGTRFSASFDIADAYNPRSTLVAVNRSEGITAALIAPMPAEPDEFGNVSSVFSGLASLVSLHDAPPYLLGRGAAMVINLGESGSALAAGSRAAALQILRAALDEALDYRQNKAAHSRGEWRDYATSAEDLEALQPVIDGRVPLLASLNRASDIAVAMVLARDYGIRLIILGGAEAWMLADRIADARVGVILDASNNLPGSFEQLNARLDSAAILDAAGVQLTFGGASANQTHNARNITQAAGIAVANGLDWDDALRAITLTPAEIFGIADRYGSLEPGKVADLVIWPADPLELSSFPDAVYINGRAVSLENRQTLLRDRYLQWDSEKPPAFRR